ncbi:hypothetical protein [Aurantiacibacter marinus]|uniref:MFS transporter n=1 Tax=Aurantiacibacter marinus TaxID=874156 RepID=A0A0H0XQY4_9SPHN|nr:hypothetical protein [Aurantiacibacter marinus]KLI64396.1 hypothetical protein AAV99_01915 [Aurantiacibacter marinus]
MIQRRTSILRFILRSAALLIALNEIRGIILAAPVFYAMYQAGGTLMALWLGASSLLGIALSVIIPLFAVKRLEAKLTPEVART